MMGETVLCACGHDRASHHPDGGVCHECPGCWEWSPPGTARAPAGDRRSEGITSDEPPAGPNPDPFDADWDELGETGSIHWRIGVLDKDQISDPDAIQDNAALIAGWYVHDCAALLERLRVAEATIGRLSAEVQDLTKANDGLHRQQMARWFRSLKAILRYHGLSGPVQRHGDGTLCQCEQTVKRFLAGEHLVNPDQPPAATTTRGAGQ